VDLQSGFIVYLCLTLAALVALAAEEWWRTRLNGWHMSRELLCRCDDCHFAFVVQRGARTARCPRCDRLCAIRERLH